MALPCFSAHVEHTQIDELMLMMMVVMNAGFFPCAATANLWVHRAGVGERRRLFSASKLTSTTAAGALPTAARCHRPDDGQFVRIVLARFRPRERRRWWLPQQHLRRRRERARTFQLLYIVRSPICIRSAAISSYVSMTPP